MSNDNTCQCTGLVNNVMSTLGTIPNTTSDADCNAKCAKQYNTGSYNWAAGNATVTADANSIVRSVFIILAVLTVFGVILWAVFFKGVASVVRAARRPKIGSPEFELSAKF